MKFRLCTGLAAIVCMTLVSCYPYEGRSRYNPHGKRPDQTAANPDATKKKQDELKQTAAQDEVKPQQQEATTQTAPQNPGNDTPPTQAPEPKVESRGDYQFANKVPGKEGFVFSPFNNKVIDVRDIPSGTLVQDPTFPASEKKYFRVP